MLRFGHMFCRLRQHRCRDIHFRPRPGHACAVRGFDFRTRTGTDTRTNHRIGAESGYTSRDTRGHDPRGYDCSNIDFDVLSGILSVPQTLSVETEKDQEDIDAALAAFREHFAEFEGCTIDELWYEEYASAYYSLAHLGQNPDDVDIQNVIAVFLRYSAGSDGFYTAPEGETLLIYMTREAPDSPWEFESWFENPVTERDEAG